MAYGFPRNLPGCVIFETMWHGRWDVAALTLREHTCAGLIDAVQLDLLLPKSALRAAADRWETRASINALADHLFSLGAQEYGEIALAWLMLACDPAYPTLFHRVVPQVQHILDAAASNISADEHLELQSRLNTWWKCAAGEHVNSEYSAFTLALSPPEPDDDDDLGDPSAAVGRETHADQTAALPRWMKARTPTPAAPNTVRVIVSNASESTLPAAWKDMHDKRLPLVVARDVAGVRARLHAEFPHATRVIDGLMRDLRDDRPVRLQPTILLGPAGSSKSRLVRRLAEELGGMYVGRFDCSGAHDGMFAGSPKAWSNSTASVPACAVLSGQIANPIIMLDEIEKAGQGTHNGRMWDALIPFLENETSQRYPESGLLNAQLDLSWISYIATANAVTDLPGPLRDRFRILTVPSPTLDHLPALAAVVMRDLARQDDERAHDEPLAADELAIIGRAWRAEKFSMRKLQRIVAATLEARDACARRH